MSPQEHTPTPLDTIGLKRVLAWLPIHRQKAEKAHAKAQAAGRFAKAWRDAHHHHAKMASLMQANLDVTP